MAKKSKKTSGGNAYRIKRAKNKKPIRVLEIGIVFLFFLVAAYVVSIGFRFQTGHTTEETAVEHFINLQVLNGCGERGVANMMANAIEVAVVEPLMVRVIDTDNFDNFGVEKTFVISRSEDKTAAELLTRQLGIDETVAYRAIEDNYLGINATLVLGKDYREVFDFDDESGTRH